MLKELEAKSKALREEVQKLEKDRGKLATDKDQLQQQRDALARELEGLIARRQALDKWKRAEFLLVNPNSFAVGLQSMPDGRFMVVQKSEGLLQQDAVKWAKKEGHHPIDKNPALTRRLFDQVAPGEVVPESLANEIRPYWSPRWFVPFPPERLNPPFLVFQDAERGQRRLGFFMGSKNNQLNFRGVAPTNDTIALSRVQVGSARAAEGDKILSSLNDVDFVDYCVLNAAQKLGSSDGKPSVVRVAIHLNVDALSEELKLSRQADTRGADHYFEFYARLHGKPYPRDARKEPVRILREIAMYVEDELYQKLIKLGIPVVERQQIRAIINESQFGKGLSPDAQDKITQVGATHMLFADIQAPQAGGRFHIAFRLTDARRGEVLWAETGERLTPNPSLHQRFLLHTGSLAVVKVKQEAMAGFHGIEDPPIVMPAQLGKAAAREHLVILEGPSSGNSIRYRSLFDTLTHELPRTQFESVTPVTKDAEIPATLQLRYVVWKFGSRLLPPAGRVLHVDGDRATIALGARNGIQPQDTLHVLRPTAAPAGDASAAGSNQHLLLATTLSVTEVSDGRSQVVIGDSGLPAVENESALLPNDLVIANSRRTVSVALLAPGWKAPSRDVFFRLNMKLPVAYQRVVQETTKNSQQFKDRVGEGLRQLGIPVFSEVDADGLLETGASHLLGGYIEPLDTNRYNLESMIFPLNATNIGLIVDPKLALPNLGQELARCEFDITPLSLK